LEGAAKDVEGTDKAKAAELRGKARQQQDRAENIRNLENEAIDKDAAREAREEARSALESEGLLERYEELQKEYEGLLNKYKHQLAKEGRLKEPEEGTLQIAFEEEKWKGRTSGGRFRVRRFAMRSLGPNVLSSP